MGRIEIRKLAERKARKAERKEKEHKEEEERLAKLYPPLEGEIETERALEIMNLRNEANPTLEEVRMIARDALLATPHIGIVVVRDLVQQVILPSGDDEFRTAFPGAPEFTEMHNRWGHYLK